MALFIKRSRYVQTFIQETTNYPKFQEPRSILGAAMVT
jgi:hypothetical protein